MINPSFHCFLGLWLPSPNVFWEPKYFSFFSVCEAFRKNKGPLCAGLLQDDMIYSQFMKASGRFLQRRKWCFIFSVCLCERRLWSWCEQWRPPEKSATCHQRKSRLKKNALGTVWVIFTLPPWWRDGDKNQIKSQISTLTGPVGPRSHKTEWSHHLTWKLSTQGRTKNPTSEVLRSLPEQHAALHRVGRMINCVSGWDST